MTDRVSPAVFWAWVPVPLWTVVIFLASSVPGSELPVLPGQSDKLVHAAVYAILGALVVRAARLTWPRWTRARLVAAATIFCLLYGASDEFHQSFTPKRTPDWHDLLADTIGGAIGGLLGAAILTLIFARPVRRR
jgi:VanZ family protein